MTKIEIPLPPVIQVRNVANYKGNDRAVLLIDGEQALYREGHVEDEEAYGMYFRSAFVRMFVRYLSEHEPNWLSPDEPDATGASGWSTQTDREIDASQYETIRLVKEEY